MLTARSPGNEKMGIAGVGRGFGRVLKGSWELATRVVHICIIQFVNKYEVYYIFY